MTESHCSTTSLIPFGARMIGQETVQSVDARDLHTFLGISREYSTWIKTWIKRAHLIENRDYVVFDGGVKNPKGGRPTIEYALTFDAAKHVAMMSGSAKGIEVREYFIACEKALTAQQAPGAASPWDIMAHLVETGRQQEQRLQALEAQQRDQMTATIQALQESNNALQAANQAMHGQAWLTIHQYVTIQGLAHQIPLKLQQEYGRYLAGYCLEKGYRTYSVPVAHEAWKDEKAYWVEAINATLPGWLTRRERQQDLQAG